MKRGMIAITVASLLAAPSAFATLLVNGGFETGDLTGWNIGPGDVSVGAPGVGAFDGSFALRLNSPTDGVPEVNQGSFEAGGPLIPAAPGQEFNLSGYMLTETALPAGATFGLFKIVFEDAAGNDLVPASVSIGQNADPAFPGAESLPFLNDAVAANTWIFSEAQAVAPAGTASVQFLALNVDFGNGANHPMWYDNIVATPEPASLSLLALAALALRRR